MRRIMCHAVLLSALLLLFSISAFAEEAVVTGNGVNVRTGPGPAYAIFDSLDRDTSVEVLNRSDPDWYLVSYGGSSGYVSSQFLELAESSIPASDLSSQNELPGYVDGMYVSFRSGPSTDSTILGTYSTGKKLSITGSSGEWTAVRIDGQDGFVFGQFVKAGTPTAAVTEIEQQVTYGGTPFFAEGSAPVTTIKPEGSTVFMILEQATPAPEATLPPEQMVRVPTDGMAHVSTPIMDTSEQQSSVTQSSAFIEVPAATPAAGTLFNVTEPRQVMVSVPASEPSLPPVSTSVPAAPLIQFQTDAAQAAEAAPSESAMVKLGRITGDGVRLRTGPGSTYSIVGTYDKGTEVSISGLTDGWTAVSLPAKGVSGYIFSDFIQSVEPGSTESIATSAASSGYDPASFRISDGFITGSCVRLRSAPSMSSDILDELNFGTAVRMVGVSGDWIRVIVGGREGYVSASFVAEGTFEPSAGLSSAAGTELGKEIAAYALQYVGTPYKWGGKSPETGFDCSGFVQYVFGQFGYTTSRIANDALSDGVHVDPADLQPGDMLCFYSGSNYVGHLGIYVGDGMFVHAANSTSGVVTTTLTSGYYAARGYEIRRLT